MPVLDVRDLKAYYITDRYGRISRVRAVDEVSFQVHKMKYMVLQESLVVANLVC